MSQNTIEALTQRIANLEKLVFEHLRSPRSKNWRSVVGMFKNSEFTKQVDAEGQAIRKAERQDFNSSR